MASPTLIAFSEADSGNATALSETTGTLTWQTGDVLVAVAIDEGAVNGITFSITNTGSGLAWTTQQSHSSSNDCTAYAWTAVATANGSGTVTVNHSGNNRMAMGAYQFRAPASYAIAVGNTKLATGQTTSPQQAALSISSADSSVVWAAGDWSAAAAESPSPAATTHSSGSPGPSASPVSAVEAGAYTFYIDELDDEASSGSVNFGYSGSSVGPFTIVAVEVKITGGGAIPALIAAPPHR